MWSRRPGMTLWLSMGEQSLHDDVMDRSLASSGQDGKKDAQIMLVSSRLKLKSILAVAAGQHHSAVATSQGSLYVVGKNAHGCVDPNSLEGHVSSCPMLLDCISHVRVVQAS